MTGSNLVNVWACSTFFASQASSAASSRAEKRSTSALVRSRRALRAGRAARRARARRSPPPRSRVRGCAPGQRPAGSAVRRQWLRRPRRALRGERTQRVAAVDLVFALELGQVPAGVLPAEQRPAARAAGAEPLARIADAAHPQPARTVEIVAGHRGALPACAGATGRDDLDDVAEPVHLARVLRPGRATAVAVRHDVADAVTPHDRPVTPVVGAAPACCRFGCLAHDTIPAAHAAGEALPRPDQPTSSDATGLASHPLARLRRRRAARRGGTARLALRRATESAARTRRTRVDPPAARSR